MEEVLQEIEAVKSIFCNDEKILIEEGHDQIILSIHLDPSKISSDLVLTFTLLPDYPTSVPAVSIKSAHLSRSHCELLKQALEQQGDELKGDAMLYQLISSAYQYFEGNICLESEAKHRVEPSQIYTSLLQLDHMRNKSQYCKVIDRWTKDLNLVGRIVFCQKIILIVLQGTKEDIKKYICLNRTQLVDVDSRGRPCKERLLTVLREDLKYEKVFSDFSTWDVLDVEHLKQGFQEVGLGNLADELKLSY